jgi:hypothetical protein
MADYAHIITPLLANLIFNIKIANGWGEIKFFR